MYWRTRLPLESTVQYLKLQSGGHFTCEPQTEDIFYRLLKPEAEEASSRTSRELGRLASLDLASFQLACSQGVNNVAALTAGVYTFSGSLLRLKPGPADSDHVKGGMEWLCLTKTARTS